MGILRCSLRECFATLRDKQCNFRRSVVSRHPRYLAPGEPEPGTGKSVEQGRVYINKAQYFGGISPDVWNFQIGGYQVLHKWMKDRKERTLSFGDILHYQKIIVALKETIRLMAEIDEAIPAWPIL